MGTFERQIIGPVEHLSALEGTPAVIRAQKFYAKYSGPTRNLTPVDQQAIIEQIQSMKVPWKSDAREVFNILIQTGVFSLAPAEAPAQPEPTPTTTTEDVITTHHQLRGLKILGKINLKDTSPQPTTKSVSTQPAIPAYYSHRTTTPIAPTVVQLPPEQQAILDANMDQQQRVEDYNSFKSDKHISELVTKLPNYYEFTEQEELILLQKFSGMYPEDEIHANCTQLRAKLNLITKSNAVQSNPELLEYMKKLATLAERGLAHAISELKWFGVSKYLIPTHIYDDVLAGIDCVLQHLDRIAHSVTYTGIDITFASLKHDTYKNKIRRTLDTIRTNKAPQLHYQLDERSEPIELLSVPKLILHLDKKTLDTLLHITEDAVKGEQNESHKDRVLGHGILRQLIEQTQAFLEYAEYCKSQLVDHYRATLKTLRSAAYATDLPTASNQVPLPITLQTHTIIAEYKAEHRHI
jgi:hypothetical protein